jgi:hypothetical protein
VPFWLFDVCAVAASVHACVIHRRSCSPIVSQQKCRDTSSVVDLRSSPDRVRLLIGISAARSGDLPGTALGMRCCGLVALTLLAGVPRRTWNGR